jgi:serine/threonine protein kinase
MEALIRRVQALLPRTPSPGEQATPPPTDVGAAADLGFLSPAQAADELGRLGHYRVLRLLGRGGMGMVFEAQDLKLHRLVALKVMLPGRLADAEGRSRFLQEARAAAAVEHERVVTVYEADEANGVPFLAMQLLQGESLEARLRRCSDPYPVSFIVRLAREIAEGLDAAHRGGLVHRDVKPSNLWLQAGDDRVKILDFGLASVARSEARLTQSGVIVGTPGFLAPEQAAGRAVDARSDLFSLGVVLYRLATGSLPFEGADVLALLAALAVDTPRPAGEFNPDLPPPLSRLIMCLLSKAPDDRPPSARAVIDALAALEDRPSPAEPTPPPSSRATVPRTADEPTRPAARGSAGSRRRRLVLMGSIAAVALAAALGLAWLARWRPALDRGAGNPVPGPNAAPPAAGTWTVLFRADDPSVWNTDSAGQSFAVPLHRVPEDVRYLRLRRLDTGEALLLPVTRSQLFREPGPDSRGTYWWNGTARAEHGGRHLGIVQAPRFAWPNHRGVISVTDEGWDAYSGSGFGHKCQVNDRQYHCWQGKEIPPTAFEIAVSPGPLTEAEARRLLK